MKRETIGLLLIAISAIAVLFGLLSRSPIPQDLAYHNFSDSVGLFNIPNILNVLSNLPFLVVGLLGLYKLTSLNSLNVISENKFAYIALFFGTTLVAFGSGYYHVWPDNQTLVWDRLPMTIAFMGLFSIVISEFISIKLGKALLLPLLAAGLFSVFYWHITEANGQGDLRYYAIVQFFPILAIPIILITFKSSFSQISAYWWLLASYIAAKLFEHYDVAVHDMLTVVSGHSIKHVAAAIGVYILLRSYENRVQYSQ
ncbi:MAG: ceramidase domain-containing protein [Gammaproteobacteria bacterium]